MNCATYSRVSTDDQVQGYSLDSQRRELRDLTARKGYTIIAELSDDGVSGATLDRPALNRLRDGARSGAYGVILVHAPDRLSRSLAHQLVLFDEFQKAGVRVEFVTTPTEDTPEGRLLLHVSGVIAEFEREKIRERTSRGKKEKARRGLIVSPRSAPFGYHQDAARPGHLMIHEGEADVVRLIYRLCIDERRSVRGITMELRRLGIRSARGRWTPQQVRRVLSEGYAGTRWFNRKQIAPDGRARMRDAAEWIAIPTPAIVTPERERAARAQLDRNRLTLVGRPPVASYLLRGLLVCATCHRRYRGSTTGAHRTYRHQNGERALACPARRHVFTAQHLETDVRAALTAALSNPGALRQAADAYEQQRGARDVEVQSQVSHLQRQIEHVRRDERRLITLAVADREQQTMIEGKLRELAQRRNGLASQLRDAEQRVAAHGRGLDPANVARICAQAGRGLSKLSDAGWQALLREVTEEVAVLPDRNVEIRGLISDTNLSHLSRPA